MSELERTLEAKCMRLVRDSGGQHRKLDVGPGGKGWVDQAVWLPCGVHFLVEFKVGRNNPSKLQAQRIEKFDRMCFDVHVIRTYQDFERQLNLYLKPW